MKALAWAAMCIEAMCAIMLDLVGEHLKRESKEHARWLREL